MILDERQNLIISRGSPLQVTCPCLTSLVDIHHCVRELYCGQMTHTDDHDTYSPSLQRLAGNYTEMHVTTVKISTNKEFFKLDAAWIFTSVSNFQSLKFFWWLTYLSCRISVADRVPQGLLQEHSPFTDLCALPLLPPRYWMNIHAGWPKKMGPACFIANILKTPRPNCVEVGELL